MLQSKFLIKTKKIVPKEESISCRLLLQGDFIEKIASGIYVFLPLGFLVLKKIEKIIRERMLKLGAQEILMPSLIPKSLWEKTKRWEKIDPPLFKLKDRHGKFFGLGSTHEEVITLLAKQRIFSYRDLPQALFQIQTKFRNEMRPTGGLLRTREFLMKDLYSFHQDEKDALSFYEKVKKTYFQIYKDCQLKTFLTQAKTGTIGGRLSHEFMVLSEAGEDKVLFCKECQFCANVEKIGKKSTCPQCKKKLFEKKGIEVGHIFFLGKKYSKEFGAYFVEKSGKKSLLIMGCYGIGLGRLMAAIVEKHHDQKGILWPEKVAPFLFHLILLQPKSKIKKEADKLYSQLKKINVEVLYDERKDKSIGEKFADSDLIGIPWRLVLSEKTLKKKKVELKSRKEEKIFLLSFSQILNFAKKYAQS